MNGLLRGLGRNVIGFGFASFFTDLGAEMITPLIPVFLETLGAPRKALGVIEGVSDAVASLLRIVSGWLSDRAGKRKIFVFAGYGVAAALRPLLGLATAAWHVGAVRIVDRIGKGIRLAPRDALIADSCEPAHRGKAFGFQRAMDNLGGVVGMLIAAALLDLWRGDVRRVFLLTAIPASCVLLVVGLVIRDRPPSAPPARLRLTLEPFGPGFRWFLATVAVFTLGNSSDLFIISRLTSVGLPWEWVPLAWCGHTVIRMAAALPAGILADRLGKKRMVLAGWAVYAAVYAALGLTESLPWTLAWVALYGLYWSLAESVLRAIVADLVPKELLGTAYGMYYFVVGIAIFPANLAFGAVWDEWGPAPAFLGSAAFAVLAGLMLLRVPAGAPLPR